MNSKPKNLTFMYTVHQCLYWAVVCCIVSFAATYLTGKGFDVSTVGIILFSSNMLSFCVQLFLANIADRAGDSRSIKTLMTVLAGISLIIMAVILLVPLPMWLMAVLYVPMAACFDMELPLMNSVVIFYQKRNFTMSYGIARAVGAAVFGAASLGMGYAIKGLGGDIMLISAMIFASAYIALAFAYPKAGASGDTGSVGVKSPGDGSAEALRDADEPASVGADSPSGSCSHNSSSESLSIGTFILRYKWYVISLAGVMMFGAAHLASENYLIEIVRPLGGDSSNVGVALMIATFLEMPVTLVAVRMYKRLGAHKMWMIIGISYTLRMLIFAMAKSVDMVYLGQCLQLTSYSLLPPSQIYYSGDCVDDRDLVKGQSVSTAAYSLGNALGNLFGGIAAASVGVTVMLKGCVGGAFAGLIIVAVFVPIAIRSRRQQKPIPKA